MVSNVTSTGSSLTELQQLLKAADADADGVVSETELKDALSDSDTAAQLVNEADSDGDGAMSLSEFSSFATQFSGATGMVLISAQEESGLARLFSKLDSDGSADLTGSEITQSLATIAAQDEADAAAAEAEAAAESETGVTTVGTVSSDDDVTISDDVQKLIDSVDANGDGVFDARDVAVMLLDMDKTNNSDSSDDSSVDDLLQATYGLDDDSDDTTGS